MDKDTLAIKRRVRIEFQKKRSYAPKSRVIYNLQQSHK